MKIIFIIVVLITFGCSAHFYKTVEVDYLKIHLTDNCGSHRGWSFKNEICVESFKENGLISPNYEILGYELTNILNKIDPKIRNPHKR